MRYVICLAALLAVSGCADLRQGLFAPKATSEPAGPAATVASVTPEETLPPPEDTVGSGNPFAGSITNPDEDGGPAAAETPSDGRLGTTLAGLDGTQEGFKVKTPLVSKPTPGRVVYLATGRSVQVELLPNNGPVGGGSQVSLAAMRMLEAPLAELSELVVYSNPT